MTPVIGPQRRRDGVSYKRSGPPEGLPNKVNLVLR